MKPRYKHDCDFCTFLGPFNEFDLYFCEQKESLGIPTLIARYGDAGPAYTSGLALKDQIPALGEAYRRAVDQGLITET